jgi:hypothetical protein
MAFIKCPECEHVVSGLAQSCIHCGFPIHTIHPFPTKCIRCNTEYVVCLDQCKCPKCGLLGPAEFVSTRKRDEPRKAAGGSNTSGKRLVNICVLLVVIFFIYVFVTSSKRLRSDARLAPPDTKESATATKTERADTLEAEAEPVPFVKVGQVLITRYFNVKVNKVSEHNMIYTGNQFSDLKAEPGSAYLVINATFKNIDNESRMITDGSLWIDYNGRKYEYDKSETIMAEGWGLFLDQINPLLSKTTNIVYKIPRELSGPIYWNPGRANKDAVIFLGNLNQ